MNTNQESENISMLMEMDDNIILNIINEYYNGNIESALSEYLLPFKESQREKEKIRIYNILSLLSPIENFIMSVGLSNICHTLLINIVFNIPFVIFIFYNA